ncbi:aspartate kinase [Fulvivirga lutea]|uniref:Aspartokinase n=1 Tax=Fulvivirga lutea TaxID=2810512 RepID=A0A974WKB4_9BACT|nr:aspartate kinase [Fulvivirga lutea]QSE98747.1 aspartate kinase [Fulvivirga lutea]
MIIYKFGGTSVGSASRMHKVADLITLDNEPKIVVLSAVSGTTNTLVEIGELLLKGSNETALKLVASLKNDYYKIVEELYNQKEWKDRGLTIVDKFFGQIENLANIPDFNLGNNKTLVAYGEILSTNLFATYLQSKSIESQLVSAFEFMTIDEDGEPEIEKIGSKLKPLIQGKALTITQGFICKNHEGQTDNLKRGGSDYTASIIGAAVAAKEVQIWTDIDGMHNNDPRVVTNTKPIEALTFDEAAELAYFGAKILHPTSILPAQKYKIPVRLKSTMDHEAKGTIISLESNQSDIKAIAAKDNITAIKIKSTRMLLAYGFLQNIFEVFGKYKTPIDMITTSEVAVSLTIDDNRNLNNIVKDLNKFGVVEVDENQTIICIVGNMVSEKSGMLKKIFDSISDIPVRMVSYGGSRHNISLLIDSTHKTEILKKLNLLF